MKNVDKTDFKLMVMDKTDRRGWTDTKPVAAHWASKPALGNLLIPYEYRRRTTPRTRPPPASAGLLLMCGTRAVLTTTRTIHQHKHLHLLLGPLRKQRWCVSAWMLFGWWRMLRWGLVGGGRLLSLGDGSCWSAKYVAMAVFLVLWRMCHR